MIHSQPVPPTVSRTTEDSSSLPLGHTTVLREEAVAALAPRAGGVYVDATFGGGGHSTRLLEYDPPVGLVLAIDADDAARPRAQPIADLPGNGGRFRLVHRNFRDLAAILAEASLDRVDGVLFDLGLSSYQLDAGARGFSFRFDAPLDMRFDQSSGMTAAELIHHASESELARILWEFGEEKGSRRIAAAIARERQRNPILTTSQLADLVESTVGMRRQSPIHPATRTFQALRVQVNAELEALTQALIAAVNALVPGGRLVVIAFHSLEDRIVKRFIEAESRTCVCLPEQPICTCDTIPRLRRIGRPVRPTSNETTSNPRSRSAIMRVAERLDADGNVADQGRSG